MLSATSFVKSDGTRAKEAPSLQQVFVSSWLDLQGEIAPPGEFVFP
jgi:hypothetical protein